MAVFTARRSNKVEIIRSNLRQCRIKGVGADMCAVALIHACCREYGTFHTSIALYAPYIYTVITYVLKRREILITSRS